MPLAMPHLVSSQFVINQLINYDGDGTEYAN